MLASRLRGRLYAFIQAALRPVTREQVTGSASVRSADRPLRSLVQPA